MKTRILEVTVYSAAIITIMIVCALAYNGVVPAYQ